MIKIFLCFVIWSVVYHETLGLVDPVVLFAYKGTHRSAVADIEFIKNEYNFPKFEPNTLIYPICLIEESGSIFYAKKRYNDIRQLEDAGEVKCRYNNFQPSILEKEERGEKIEDHYIIRYKVNKTSYNLEDEKRFFDIYNNRMDGYEKHEALLFFVYDVKINRDLLRVDYVSHTVFPKMHSNNYSEKCDNYDFGLDVFGRDIGEFYDVNNQKELFERLDISTSSPPYGYFVEHLMAPIQDNVNEVVRSGLCSHLNTVPLWEVVSEGSVRKVEEFIRRVADIIGYVDVKTEVFGTLMFPNEVYLDPNSKKIAVPEVISKSLSFVTENESFKEEKYFLVVFIHNEPTDQIKHTFCDESVCELYGWDFGIGNVEIGSTYCCLYVNADLPLHVGKADPSESGDLKPFDLKRNILVRYDVGNVEYANVFNRLKEGKPEN